MRDREMAQDALQQVLLRYFVARSSGQEIQNGKSWLYRVLRNYLLDRIKEAAFKNKASLEEAESIPDISDPEKEYFRAFTRKQILEVLAPRELECLQLRAEGFDYKEIAQILNVRSGTVGDHAGTCAEQNPKGSEPHRRSPMKTFFDQVRDGLRRWSGAHPSAANWIALRDQADERPANSQA